MLTRNGIRRIRFIALFIVLALIAPGLASAQDGPRPQHNDPFWTVEYWNNSMLAGQPLVTGADAAIDFNWGQGSPNAKMGADNFSARWMRYLSLDAGTYRFTARSDDGVRVYVDDVLIIDQWNDHAAQTFSVEEDVSTGHHLVRVEYYERSGLAEIAFNWERVSQSSNAWRGEYYNNATLSGSPTVVREDAKVDFDWGFGSPSSGLQVDNFSVRWTRTVDFTAGRYRFTTSTDDGVRLWVNGHLLIDKWVQQAATSYTETIYVNGSTPLKMEYFEGRDHAVARLTWTRAEGEGTIPPTGGIIVDDEDPGFVKGGSPGAWRTAAEGHDGRLVWTKNNDRARSNYNWARWYPQLRAGRYEVFVYIPFRYTTTASARYWIAHGDGYTLKIVDQSANGDAWVSLGTYRFEGDERDYVSLSDVTGEDYLSRLIAFDAVQWVAR